MKIVFSDKVSSINLINNFINSFNGNKEPYINKNNSLQNCVIFIHQKNSEYYSQKLFNFLKKSIKYSSEILLKKNNIFTLQLFNKHFHQWKICIFINAMLNLPFTLDDIIFIPYDYLYKSFLNHSTIKFSNTLIHEKIHILQRNNLLLWYNFSYLLLDNWVRITSRKINYFLNNFDFSSLSVNRIYNPDVFYCDNYYYLYNNKKYFAILSTNNKSFNVHWFQIYFFNNQIFFTSVDKYLMEKFLPKEEHPFETFAYNFADYLS